MTESDLRAIEMVFESDESLKKIWMANTIHQLIAGVRQAHFQIDQLKYKLKTLEAKDDEWMDVAASLDNLGSVMEFKFGFGSLASRIDAITAEVRDFKGLVDALAARKEVASEAEAK